MTAQFMTDPFGRHITYLRVSVTDRCDFRCVYCMSEDMTFLPKAELLTLEELDRLCSAFVVHRSGVALAAIGLGALDHALAVDRGGKRGGRGAAALYCLFYLHSAAGLLRWFGAALA